ncbi:heparinase II/III domain-containing protein [Xylanimonas sp. McL0601]|uniref:heparinase II/III domain-containing protein n=1 Tax=Xylanimonas sp. McL0601 TaxID=3414739 RepID=UPI003CF5B5EE
MPALDDAVPAFRGPLAAAFADALDSTPLRTLLLPPGAVLPVAPATDRATWDLTTGTADRVTLDDVVARARADVGTPWPIPLASTAVRRYRDGDRTAHEALVFARTRRVSRAVVAAAAAASDPAGDTWLDEAVDGLLQLCEQSSWCWPAHDDTLERHGAVVPTVTDPYLDLGAGEVAAQLAWADQLLGPLLEARWPGVRSRLRHEARVRVLEPFVRRRDWHWIGLDGDPHNWNPWIHGNVLVAALRLLDSPDDAALREHVVALVIEGLDRYVANLPDDGAVDEGFHYWWNGAGRALEALELLAHATAGALDATAVPALRATVAFPHRVHLGGPWHLNLADGPARASADATWAPLHRAARRAGDADALAHAAAHRVPGTPAASEAEGLGRLLRTLTDDAWVRAAGARSPLPRDVWLPSVQVLVARERPGSDTGLTLAAKGGHNGEHHNHADVGSFVVASDGVPVLVDAGRPTYTAATFGPDRYSVWPMQSAWHNVPEVRGAAQGIGRRFAASVVRAVTRAGEDGAESSAEDRASGVALDLAEVFPVPGLRTWRREAVLHRAPSARVEVRDAWELDAWDGPGDEPPTVVRLLVAGEVSLHHGGAVVVPLDGATPVRLSWPADLPASRTVRELDDPMLSAVWGERLTRVELDVTHRRDVVVAVVQQPTTPDPPAAPEETR